MRTAFAGCVFDSGTRQVTGRSGGALAISPKAFQLLEALILARPKAVSKEDLHALLWPNTFVEEANLPNLVAELRSRLGDDARNPRIIRTVQRFGYSFVAADEQPLDQMNAPAAKRDDRSADGGSAPAVEVVSQTKRFLRPVVLGALASLALVAVGLVSRRYFDTSRRGGVPFKARDWVLVAGFENRTGQPLLDGTLEYALTNELSRSRYVNVAPRERIADALRLMRKPPDTRVDAAIGREICLRDGEIRALITGRIERVGSRYLLSVELVDPTQGASVSSAVEEAPSDEQLLPGVRRISEKVRASLGENRPSIREDRERLVKVTTTSLKALQLYSRADAVIAGINDAVAEELLRQAVAEDPEFASAYIHLAHAIHNQGKPKEEFLPPAETAFRLSEKTTERERYFIQGSYYGFLGEDAKAITAYETLLTLYPDHYWGLNNLAAHYYANGRIKDGAELRARLADMRPKDFATNAIAAGWLVPLDPIRSRSYARRADELITPSIVEDYPFLVARTELVPAKEQWLAGEPEESLRLADGVASKLDSLSDREKGVFADQLFPVYLELGQLEAAARVLRKVPDPLLRNELLSRVEYARGDLDATKRLLEDSRQGAWDRANNRYMRSILLARAGLLPEASEFLARLEECCADFPWLPALRGEIGLARGDLGEAMSRLEEGIGVEAEPFYFPRFVASESLAVALSKKGDLARAITVLERASTLRRRAVFEEAGQYWVRIRYQLAQFYRKSGRDEEARAVEDELRKLLALADPDHPIRRALDRLRG